MSTTRSTTTHTDSQTRTSTIVQGPEKVRPYAEIDRFSNEMNPNILLKIPEQPVIFPQDGLSRTSFFLSGHSLAPSHPEQNPTPSTTLKPPRHTRKGHVQP
jgi:hypothetical protein